MLTIVVPVLVGGLIGYCTNYIAIKMLFRPRHEVYIGKWKLPFTPGVIPKNQKRIAGAVGNAVSEQLITREDLMRQIGEGEVKEKIAGSLVDGILSVPVNLRDNSGTVQKVGQRMAAAVLTEIDHIDLVPSIRAVGNQTLQEYLQNPMLAMFLNPGMLEAVYAKIDTEIKNYVQANGEEIICDFVQKKADEMGEVTGESLLQGAQMDRSVLDEKAGQLVEGFIAEKGMELLGSVNIKKIVQDKIEAMDVEQLEDLVMYVMENELKAVINLGAVIGALIGMINIWI